MDSCSRTSCLFAPPCYPRKRYCNGCQQAQTTSALSYLPQSGVGTGCCPRRKVPCVGGRQRTLYDRSRPVIRSKALIAYCCEVVEHFKSQPIHRVFDAKVTFKTPNKGTGVLGKEHPVHRRYTIPLKHVLSSMQERWQFNGCLDETRLRHEKPFAACTYRVDDLVYVLSCHSTTVRISPTSCTYRARLPKHCEDFNNLCLLSGPLKERQQRHMVSLVA